MHKGASGKANLGSFVWACVLLTSAAMHKSYALVGLLLIACEAGVDDAGGEGGASSNPSSGSGSGFGGEGQSFGGGSGECTNHCTADLKAYVDCDGNVISECPDGLGCAPGGACVEACEAAAANQSTIGCDFYSVTPPVVFGSRGGCFAAMIANTWSTPVAIGLEYDGMILDAAAHTFVPVGQGQSLTYQPLDGGMLAPGQLGVIMLSHYNAGFEPYQVDCPAAPAVVGDTQLDATGIGSSFHITASAPVVAYDVYPWGGATSYATSATLLLPTPSWGTNVVTADAWEAQNGQPFTQIIAAEDNTTVTIAPTRAIVAGGGLPAIAANTAGSFTLQSGQVAQILQGDRLAGSALSADKPISVWGGSSCMNIPTGMEACDAAHQQLLPVPATGSAYVAARYPSRGGDDNAPYTFVGLVDGTTLTYDPPVSGAPTTLDSGQLAIVNASAAFTVSSQDEDHPFYVAAHMTGGGTNPDGLGDPEYVNLVPPTQYLSKYLFVTDPTYAYTTLVLTRTKAQDGQFHPVYLDCVGEVTSFMPVGTAGEAEVARVPVVSGGSAVGSCQNGVHTADSAAPFGLTVWGYDYYASYAYPAGMAVEPINTVVVPPVPR